METKRAREPYSTAVETPRQQFHTLFPISFYILSLYLCFSSTSRVSLNPQGKQEVVMVLHGNPVKRKQQMCSTEAYIRGTFKCNIIAQKQLKLYL